MFIHSNSLQRIELPRQTINGKRYYSAPGGEKYASVTTILGHKEKPEIKEWQQSLGISKAKKETARCADRGTAVHDMLEKYLQNNPTPIKNHERTNILLFNQLKLKANKINNIRAQELPLYSDTLKIAGTPDCIGDYENILSVIDFKTSNNNKNHKMVEDYRLQCCAYAICILEMFDIWIEQHVILMAVEKGLAPLVFIGNNEDYVKPLTIRVKEFYNALKIT